MRALITTILPLVLLIQSVSADEEQREFKPRQVVAPVRAITDARVSGPDKMAHPVAASDLVLGLTIGEVARAYPINMLTGPSREIINDKLGGRSIAATW